MFPIQHRAFADLLDKPLPDFRRIAWYEGPQLAVVGGWLLLTAGAIIVNFHGRLTLWELECNRGLPIYAPIFLLISHVSLALAIWRCYWPLWITAFTGNVAFALLFAFFYLPLARPPLVIPGPPIGPQAEAVPANPDVPEEMFFCQEGDAPLAEADFAVPPARRPNLMWVVVPPAYGSFLLLLGPWLLYLAAAWSAVTTYRRSTSP